MCGGAKRVDIPDHIIGRQGQDTAVDQQCSQWQMNTAWKEKLVKRLTCFRRTQEGDWRLRETSRKRFYHSLLGEMKWD